MSSETGANEQDELVTIAEFPEPMEANMATVGAGSRRGSRVFLQGENCEQHDSGGVSCRNCRCARRTKRRHATCWSAMDDDPESLESVTAAEIAAEGVGEVSRPRAVVCLSGGMDSTVCATLAARDYDAYGVHFSYGQRTEARELRSAREVAKAVGLQELMELEMDLFRRIGGSALTDASIDVPVASAESEGNVAPLGRRGSGDLCSVPECAFPERGGELG